MQENAVRHRLGARWARARALVCVSATVAGLLLMAGCGGSEVKGPATGLDTLDPGVLRVAAQSYMPYSAIKGSEIVGLDGEILQHVADRLDLKIEPQLTDFNGMLGGVQSHRVDITIGGVAWTKERASQGLFTDPPYYSPPAMGVASGKHYATIEDLAGQRLGTVTGYVWVKSIQAVPGAKLGAYPSALGVFDDLASGRLDVGFLDPLLIVYYQKQRPDRPMQTEYLTPPTAAQIKQHPEYDFFAPYQTSFYIPKQEPKLEAAISREIRAMYADGSMAKLIAKWGGDARKFLTPTPAMAAACRGVDRPSNWTPPSL
jgi:polar amino acid transport system substrate-binding protein